MKIIDNNIASLKSNDLLALEVIQAALIRGVTEFCICPGNRNSPLFFALTRDPRIKSYFWPEERSAAFFALGRSRTLNVPVAVVTTSGTAAGELFPAAMEAYYTGIPLLLITADRPNRFRGCNAPQSAEQTDLYGVYTPFSMDIDCKTVGLSESLLKWDGSGPAHLNVSFEEPDFRPIVEIKEYEFGKSVEYAPPIENPNALKEWLEKVETPLVIVGALKCREQHSVKKFLMQLKAPVFLEAISGLREDSELQQFRIARTDNLWKAGKEANYSIDSVLRIGAIPTFRLWRDLEEFAGKVDVFSLNTRPFSGISWHKSIFSEIPEYLSKYKEVRNFISRSKGWCEADQKYRRALLELIYAEPRAESSLIFSLSKQIAQDSFIYLGNSLPIREWDLTATEQQKDFRIAASRGLNGIDGQISTFLGMSSPTSQNWGIFGDLTTLYDMAAPWILSQIPDIDVNIVVVNNFGGKIFDRFVSDPKFCNPHRLRFKPLADMWGLEYEYWETIPQKIKNAKSSRLIEIVPDDESSKRFWKKIKSI